LLPTSSDAGQSEVGMQKKSASAHVVTPLPVDVFPLLPASAHRTIAVSLIEFCQHPLEPCENRSQSFAFVTCSADEEPREIRASDVS